MTRPCQGLWLFRTSGEAVQRWGGLAAVGATPGGVRPPFTSSAEEPGLFGEVCPVEGTGVGTVLGTVLGTAAGTVLSTLRARSRRLSRPARLGCRDRAPG